MHDESRFTKSMLKLDRILAILGIILSLFLIAFISLLKPRIVYLLPAVLIIVTCSIWLLRGRFLEHKPSEFQSTTWVKLLASVFFIMLTLSILTIYTRASPYERPLSYFIIVSLMAGILAMEIFASGKKHPGLILSQIIAFGIGLAWSQLFIYPNSLVGIDPWFHQAVTISLVESHSIPGTTYYSLPIFHLLTGTSMLVLNVDYKIAVMASASLVQILVTSMVVYSLGKFVLNDTKIGLMAALVLAISDNFISFNFWTVPTSLAAVFVLLAVLFLLKTRFTNPLIAVVLVCLMIFMSTLTNTITSALLIVVAFAGFIASRLFRIREGIKISKLSINIPVLSITIVFAWWAYASNYLLRLADIIRYGLSRDYYSRGHEINITYATAAPLIDQILKNSNILVLFALSIFGVLYMVSRKGQFSVLALAFIGLAPLVIGFASLVFGGAALEQRWWYYSQILLSVAVAVAFMLFAKSKAPKGFRVAVICIAIIAICFASILSPIANMDNRTLSENLGVRLALTDSEIQSADTVSHIWQNTTFTDWYYRGAVNAISNRTYYMDNALYQGSFLNYSHGLILLRSEILNNTFELYGQPYRLDYDPHLILEDEGFSRIYASNSTQGYLLT